MEADAVTADAIQHVQVGVVRVALDQRGTGDPVLYLNGTGESGATWGPLLDLLPGWRHIATDARDTGHTVAGADVYTPKDLAADAAGVIEALDIGPCHVVGYSLGGATAQELAIARPDLVRSLVHLSTWARSDGWFRAQMRTWQSIRLAHPDDEAAFLRALGVFMFSPATFDDRVRMRAILDLWGRDEPAQSVAGWLRQTDADMAHDAADRLSSVRAPSLVVVGEDDVCTPARYATELCALLPNAELVLIPRAGHAAVFEQTTEVAAALKRFWARV